MQEIGRVRWVVTVPKRTDAAVRAYLSQAGLAMGALSRFVAEAVRWRSFELNVTAARVKNAVVPAAEIEKAIDQAIAEIDRERARKI